MDNTYFVTITGLCHYYGKKPFEIGRIIKLIKEPDNVFDKEAIAATLPFIDKIGYVANSINTVYSGTISAGRLYDKIKDYAYGKVLFVTHSSAIVLVLDKEDVEESDEENDKNNEHISVPAKESKSEKKIKKSKKVKQPIGFKA